MATQEARIYVKKSQEETWKAFKKINKRDCISTSSRIMDYVTEYVGLHGDGNTQTKLEFAEQPLCLPKYRTCEFSNKKLEHRTFMCLKDSCRKIPKACDNCKTYRTVKREE